MPDPGHGRLDAADRRPTTDDRRVRPCWRWYERWCGDGTWAKVTAALDLPAIEVGREPRHASRGVARSKPTVEVAAIEVRPSTARRGRPVAIRQSA